MPNVDPDFANAACDVRQTSEQKHYAKDCELARRLIVGDASAWQFFVREFGTVIRARVADVASSFGRGTDGAAIDDATADVFAALLQNDCAALRAFEGRSALTTYLVVIATRCSTRGFAKKRVLIAADQEQEFQELPSAQSSDPSQSVLAEEQKSEIAKVLGRLPEKQRQVVELFHLRGASYAEISKQLGMPLGSVGVTLKRSEAKIRELLEPD
ncbi:MAG: sigma-70 family RNA polymerase sigma factor [Planctomycetota bacterium]